MLGQGEEEKAREGAGKGKGAGKGAEAMVMVMREVVVMVMGEGAEGMVMGEVVVVVGTGAPALASEMESMPHPGLESLLKAAPLRNSGAGEMLATRALGSVWVPGMGCRGKASLGAGGGRQR